MLRTKFTIPLVCALFLSACTFNQPTNVSKNIEPVPTTTPSPSPSPTATPKPSPKYTVTFLSTPNVGKIWTESTFLDIKIKNISVEPFITGLYVSSCNFTDDTNTARSSAISFDGGRGFEKAILPGEERTLSQKPFSLDAGGMSGTNAKGQICGYDASGNYNCKMVEGLKILSCKVQIKGGPDSLSMTVKFPTQ